MINGAMAALAGFVVGGSGAGLLVLVSLAAIAGVETPSGLLLLALALTGLGLLAGARRPPVPGGGGRGWMGALAALAVALPLGGAALGWPDLITLVWVPALLALVLEARVLETAGDSRLWRDAVHLPLFLCGALAEAAGLAVLALPLLVAAPSPDWAGAVLVGLLGARFLIWMAYRRRITAIAASDPDATLLLAFSAPFALGGTVAPLALTLVAGTSPELAPAALPAAGLAVTASGWAMRGLILARGGFTL